MMLLKNAGGEQKMTVSRTMICHGKSEKVAAICQEYRARDGTTPKNQERFQ